MVCTGHCWCGAGLNAAVTRQLCAVTQALAVRGSFRGERAARVRLGRGVWRVLARGEPCGAPQDCLGSAWHHGAGMDSQGVRGFVAVPVWVNGLTTVWVSPSLQCKLSGIIMVEAGMELLSWTAFLGGLQPQQCVTCSASHWARRRHKLRTPCVPSPEGVRGALTGVIRAPSASGEWRALAPRVLVLTPG